MPFFGWSYFCEIQMSSQYWKLICLVKSEEYRKCIWLLYIATKDINQSSVGGTVNIKVHCTILTIANSPSRRIYLWNCLDKTSFCIFKIDKLINYMTVNHHAYSRNPKKIQYPQTWNEKDWVRLVFLDLSLMLQKYDSAHKKTYFIRMKEEIESII